MCWLASSPASAGQRLSAAITARGPGPTSRPSAEQHLPILSRSPLLLLLPFPPASPSSLLGLHPSTLPTPPSTSSPTPISVRHPHKSGSVAVSVGPAYRPWPADWHPAILDQQQSLPIRPWPTTTSRRPKGLRRTVANLRTQGVTMRVSDQLGRGLSAPLSAGGRAGPRAGVEVEEFGSLIMIPPLPPFPPRRVRYPRRRRRRGRVLEPAPVRAGVRREPSGR